MSASPKRAPHANEKRNLMTNSKQPREQHFFARSKTIAARNPIKDIPKPARNPNPQTCSFVKVVVTPSVFDRRTSEFL